MITANPALSRPDVPRLLHAMLACCFLFYSLIGTSPLATTTVSARVEGSPLDRLFVIGMAMLALVVLALHANALPAMIRRSAGIWIIVALALLSIFWSDYPGLTLRRAILMACLTLSAAAVAAGVRDLRAFHTVFCHAITGVIILNILIVFALPARGMSDIGAQGLYSQKNVAGMVAMTAVIASACWTFRGHENPADMFTGLFMVAVSAFFLVLTRSKTSIALVAVALAVLAILALATRGGPRAALAALLLCAGAAIAALVFLAAYDFDIAAIAAMLSGDASFTGRDELWAFALRVAQERPWLGHGYGAFWDVGIGNDPLLRFDPGSWLGDIEPGIINQAHNGYLELWIQLGLPATLLATLLVIGLILRGLACSILAGGPPGTRAAFCFLTVMPAVWLVHNFTEASLFMRGIVLCNMMLPILFLLARSRELCMPQRARRRMR